MKRFLLLFVLLAAGLGRVGAADEAKRYNVLFVIADQWRAQAFGFEVRGSDQAVSAIGRV